MEQTPSDTSVSKDQGIVLIKQKTPYQRRRTRTAKQGAPGKPNIVFTYDEQVEIVKQIALRKKPQEIMEYVKDKYNKILKPSNLSQYTYRPQWQPMIDKFREEFESRLLDEDLASKRRRVQEFSKIYWRLEKEDKNLPRAAEVLGRIREEIEGKSYGGMQITQYNQYNSMSDEELRKVIDENTKFLQIRKIEVINGEGTEGGT